MATNIFHLLFIFMVLVLGIVVVVKHKSLVAKIPIIGVDSNQLVLSFSGEYTEVFSGGIVYAISSPSSYPNYSIV